MCHHFKAHRGVHIFLGARNQLKRKGPPKSKIKMDGERRTRLFPFDGTTRVQLRGHPEHLPHMCIINIWIYTLIPEGERMGFELPISSRACSTVYPILDCVQSDIISCMTINGLGLLNLPGFRMTHNPLQSDMTFNFRLNNHYLLQDMLSV